MDTTKSLALVNKEISRELADPAIMRALLKTTFKGLDETAMRQAIFEGMVRGFKFKDFLEKNVYAIPFKEGYSLVTSIDHARKIGMKSGIIGKSAPEYSYYDGTGEGGKPVIESCTITVKRRVAKDIGEYTATVFFEEYNTGRNLWVSKPRTMIAKVAEMHALRMACPEEMSQIYTPEELDKEDDIDHSPIADNATVISTGDDHSVKEDKEIPQDDEARKNMILGLVAAKWPATDLKDAKAIKTAIADYTELEYVPANYESIIKKLR